MSATAELRRMIDNAIEEWKEDLAEARSMRADVQDMNCYAAGHEDGLIDATKRAIRLLITLRELAEASR